MRRDPLLFVLFFPDCEEDPDADDDDEDEEDDEADGVCDDALSADDDPL